MFNLAVLPAMLADQWDKCTATVVFFAVTVFCFNDSYQSLRFTRFADGHNQPPANLQLHSQRLRYAWTTSGYDDRIVRRVRGPAECAIETFNCGVVDLELTNTRLRFAREIADAFDRVNLCRNERQHCRLISGAGADLQHAAVAVELQQFSHASDDERLRDRLVGADR